MYGAAQLKGPDLHLLAPHQVIRGEGLIYMVLEYGDIDLARLLQRHEAAQREAAAAELDENFIRLYWQQMLQARAAFQPGLHGNADPRRLVQLTAALVAPCRRVLGQSAGQMTCHSASLQHPQEQKMLPCVLPFTWVLHSARGV